MQLPTINLYKMKRIVTIAFLFVSISTFAQSSAEEKVWSRVGALTQAIFETKDSAALADLVNDKVTYGHSGGNIENKTQMVHNAVTSATKYKDANIERVSINIDKKTAVLRHNFRATSIDDKGVESPLNLGILQVWKKEHGKWRIWARQAVRIPAKS
jgi:hypothetical protein